MKIGFIGTGVMGKSMAMHLLNANNEMHIYNRTKSKAEDLIAKGAIWHDSVKEIAECEIIMTMLGYPHDVEDIYFNEDYGLLKNAKKGTLLIDYTTSTPTLAEKIAKKAEGVGCLALDAPVSGGDIGAQNALLTIMCGGTQEAFDRAYPYLSIVGKNVILQGIAGCGQHTKMCNQIAIASGMLGVCESIAYAKKAKLDPARVLDSIGKGAASSFSLNTYTPRIIKGDYNPGFYIKHFIKDMKIAIDEAHKLGLELPGLELAHTLYLKLEDEKFQELGSQALMFYYLKEE